MLKYLMTLGEQGGAGWNRFWYTPSDAYTLGVMRLLVGLVMTYWYLTWLPDLTYFFGEKGLLPAEQVDFWRFTDGKRLPWQWISSFSLLDFVSSPTALWIVYSAGLAAIVSFTVGFYSRMSAILSYVALVSLVNRAPMLATSFESTLPLLLLGLCVGPCGASWSVDAWRARGQRPTTGNSSSVSATIGYRLIQLHLTLACAAMAIAKLRYNSWWTGSAAWLAIVRPESRVFDFSSLARWTSESEPERFTLFDAWTHLIIVYQLLFPVAIWSRLLRPLVIVISAAVWLIFAAVTGLFPFSAIMFIGGLAFVPGETLRGLLETQAQPANQAAQQTPSKSTGKTALAESAGKRG